jgi:hypothetical protein
VNGDSQENFVTAFGKRHRLKMTRIGKTILFNPN